MFQIISYILVFCSSFNAFDLSSIRRETNYVAHSSARFALDFQTCGFVIGGLPGEVDLPVSDVSLSY